MTLTAAATVQFGSPPRVLVSVASSPSVTAVLRVLRVHEDGSQHRVLTDGRAVLNGTWSGYDYHAPSNQAFTYVASTGLEADSAPSSALFIPSGQCWLHHPTDPDLSYPVEKILAPQQDVSRSSRSTDFKILGARQSVVRSDFPLESESGSFTVRVQRDEVPLVEALLADGGTVLLNGPWGSYDFGWAWLWVKSVRRSNTGGFIDFPTRNYTLDYQVVADPDADTEPVWTYDGLVAEFPALANDAAAAIWSSYDRIHLDLRT